MSVVASMASGAQNPAQFGLSANIGYSSTKSESAYRTHETTAVGSMISSGGDATIIARGREGEAGIGDLTIIGSQVATNGKVVLDAANDINLLSAEERYDFSSSNKSASSGFGVGVNIGFNGSGVGIGISANAHVSKSKGNGEGHGITHAETVIYGREGVEFSSGNDTTLRGAQIIGESVVGNVGGDLAIISEQDTYTESQRQSSSSVGGSITINIGPGTLVSNASANFHSQNQNGRSEYASVNEQSGIYAGEGGFDITVGGNTGLTGAVIASNADEDKNRLTTGTLTTEDLHNSMSYEASTKGTNIEISGGKGSIMRPPAGKDAGDDHGTTSSAIESGSITIGGEAGAYAASKMDRDNRQLHKEELKWIDRNAAAIAVALGISESDAKKYLIQESLKMVDLTWYLSLDRGYSTEEAFIRAQVAAILDGVTDTFFHNAHGSYENQQMFTTRDRMEYNDYTIFADQYIMSKGNNWWALRDINFYATKHAVSPEVVMERILNGYYNDLSQFVNGISGVGMVQGVIDGVNSIGHNLSTRPLDYINEKWNGANRSLYSIGRSGETIFGNDIKEGLINLYGSHIESIAELESAAKLGQAAANIYGASKTLSVVYEMTYGLTRAGMASTLANASNKEWLAVNSARTKVTSAGVALEEKVLSAKGLEANTAAVSAKIPRVGIVNAVPDGISGGVIVEVKDCAKLSMSEQFRVYLKNSPVNLIVTDKTHTITGPLREAIIKAGGTIEVYDRTTGTFSPWVN